MHAFRRAIRVAALAPQAAAWQPACVTTATTFPLTARGWTTGAPDAPAVPPLAARHTIGAYTPVTRHLWEDRLARGEALAAPVASSASVTPSPRLPHTTSVPYPFTTDGELAELYRNPWGAVRHGRLLEDLDSLAGNIAFDHFSSGPGTPPPSLVTASVDRISVMRRLRLGSDMEASGRVVWTGTSSMDIQIEVQQEGEPGPSLRAVFTFVARDPVTGGAVRVPPLMCETDADRRLFAERQAVADTRKDQRRRRAQGDVSFERESREWAEAMVAEARRRMDMPGLGLPNDIVMQETGQSNIFICQPQVRNLNGTVFGGFLMRRAYEVAFATCYVFAGARPTFLEVDEIAFVRPVEVADLLRLRAVVLHTAMLRDKGGGCSDGQGGASGSGGGRMGRVHVEVVASRTKPESRFAETTTVFHFTFEVSLPDGQVLKRVLPATPEDALRVLRYHPGTGL